MKELLPTVEFLTVDADSYERDQKRLKQLETEAAACKGVV